jgi:hypothetical protein
MKNKFTPALIAMLFAVLFTQYSCSKDKLDPVGGRPESNAASTNKPPTGYELNEDNAIIAGALFMQVTPLEAKAVVTVFNDTYTSGPLGMNATEGILRLENLEPGIYNVMIKPINSAYLPMLIENVEIISDSKTNLGTITLTN